MTSARHRILVADDEEDIRFLWRSALLKPAGAYEVVTVADGHQALEAMARTPFDLLVTDIWMPGMSGVELTETLRQRGHRLPIIWFTAHGLPGVEVEAERLDVFCCLYKPLRVREMRSTVAHALTTPQEQPTP